MTTRRLIPALAFTLLALGGGLAQEKAAPKADEKKVEKKLPAPAVPPTAANVPYGKLERQVLDFWQAKSDKPTPARLLHPRRRLAGRRQERLLRQRQDVPRQRHLGGHHQLPADGAGERAEGDAAGEGAARRRRPRPAVRPLQGRRMEHRQEAHRRHGRLGRRLLVAVAGVPRRHGRPQERRPGRPRIDPPVLRRGRRCAGVARPEGGARVDAELHLRRPRVRHEEPRRGGGEPRARSRSGSRSIRRSSTSPRTTRRSACTTAATRGRRSARSTPTRPTRRSWA